MKISTEQITIDTIKSIDFDLVFASSGYESRCNFLFTNYVGIKGKKKIVIGFDNYQDDLIRINNDKIFQELNFEPIVCSGNDSLPLINFLQNGFESKNSRTLNILIDYSCMTRIWYAEILKYFVYTSKPDITVNLYFNYSHSVYIEPPKSLPLNKFVSPIKGFYSITVPAKPTALIIGLGYVSTRAFGLAEYFDVTPHLFIADGTFNEKFYNDVKNENIELMNSVHEENIFYYPLNNLIFTETLLNHLCQDLLTDFRLVLAPCGPKPFTLLSLITSLRLKDTDVWRISAGENEKPIDKKPYGIVSILKVSLKD